MPTKKKHKTRQINLVPAEGLASTTSGRILLWVLSTFRLLLILTELFVIGAFLSRFWLDAKNTDLTEEMSDAKSEILALSEFEKDFKDIQGRLSVFDSYKTNNGRLNSSLKTVVSYKPQGIKFESVTVDFEKVSIQAVSVNEVEIQRYLANLKSSGKFDTVSIGNLALTKENSYFTFTVDATFRKEI